MESVNYVDTDHVPRYPQYYSLGSPGAPEKDNELNDADFKPMSLTDQ